MKLQTIQSNISSSITQTKEKVKANWNNMSTTAKVATVSGTILLAGASVAAAIFGAAGLVALAALTKVSLIAGLHGVVPAVSALCGSIALSIPGLSLLKTPKTPAEPAIELAPVAQETQAEEAPVGPLEAVQETVPVEKPVVAPSRLGTLKNKSVAFVRNHKGAIATGAIALGMAGVRAVINRNISAADIRFLIGFLNVESIVAPVEHFTV